MSQSATQNQLKSSSQDDELDLAELWKIIWNQKSIIIVFSALFSIASICYAISQPDIYKASVLLAPVDSGDTKGLAGLAGSLGGVASMAGINLGGSNSDKTAIALEILQSRKFIQSFIQKHKLSIPLIAANNYDLIKEEFIINSDVYNTDKKIWIRENQKPKTSEPTPWELYEAFSKLLAITQNKASGMITLDLSYYSPKHAKKWLTLLVRDINSFMREQDELEAKNSIDYLKKQLDKTDISSMEAVFYQLIEEQSKNLMLTQIKPEYVLKTIDPAQVPDVKDKPSRTLIVILGTLLGGILSIFIVLVRYFSHKPETSKVLNVENVFDNSISDKRNDPSIKSEA